MGGYWSLVGTDSTDGTIDPSGGPIGGLPGQRSLNLGGYAVSKPQGGRERSGTSSCTRSRSSTSTRTSAVHARSDFRWDDDPGYVPTKDARGVFVKDAAGRAPGIYTYLAGEPNKWSKAKVDHNLRTENDPFAVMGPFDPASVMLYRFAPFFYKSNPSACAPTGPGQDLSDGDKRGLALLYPGGARGGARDGGTVATGSGDRRHGGARRRRGRSTAGPPDRSTFSRPGSTAG